MNRRTRLAGGVVSLLVAASSLARAPDRVWRVGALSANHRPESLGSHPWWGTLVQELRRLGYVEGTNLEMEWRFADGQYERLPNLAKELARAHVDVIVTDSTPATRAAQRASSTVPIVFANASDPMDTGLVQSLARPGGNATGIASMTTEVPLKQLERLARLVPGLSSVGVLVNPGNLSYASHMAILEKASSIGGHVLVRQFRAQSERDLLIARLAEEHRLPSMSGAIDYPDAVGYGPDRGVLRGSVAEYVDRILKGANPGDLPVQEPTRLDLVINRKTANALGLTIPPELLVQARRVTE